MPCRSASAHGDGCRRQRGLGHAPRKIGDDPGAPRRTRLLGAFHLTPADAQHSHRRGSRRSAVQFERKRLARLLLLLANFGKEGRPEAVIPKVSQETLAEMIGTTRSRVSFFMNKFRKLGFIEYNGGLSVHSSLLNVVLHD